MCFKYPFDVFKCGKCPECLQDKRREWSIRLQLHTFFSDERPYFCHLTYDNAHVPVSESGKLTLCKEDVQLFFKRLRKNLNIYYGSEKSKDRSLVARHVKYYCAGEYGPDGTHRPHYHCIIFGLPKEFDEVQARNFVAKAWKNGDVRYRSCWLRDYSQLHYATKYIINYFDEDFEGKLAPFKLSSSGIGSTFFKYAIENDLYDIETQKRFTCKYRKSLFSDKKIPVYWYAEEPLTERDGKLVANPLLQNFRDFIEFPEYINGREMIHRYPLPRYFQEKLYTEDFRRALGIVKKNNLLEKNYEYVQQYHEYDSQCTKVPMWLQLKRYRWEHKKKNKKDKNLRVNSNDILND